MQFDKHQGKGQRPIKKVILLLILSALAITNAQAQGSFLARPDHIVLVIEENHAFSQVIGSPNAPYTNALAAQSALFTNSHGIEHPSQPNYLDLFSGSNQGVTDNTTPVALVSTPNLGGELIAVGRTFIGYSEDLPFAGFTGDVAGPTNGYRRKHNPWVNFTDIPVASNQPFAAFPTDYALLPTISFVVPNQDNDMHDGSVSQGDTWLQSHLDGYVQWARTHNSLLIVTWDEDDFSSANNVPTLFFGPMLAVGIYDRPVDHFDVLRTLEDMYALPYAGASASATPILVGVASAPEPTSGTTIVILAVILIILFLSHRMKQNGINAECLTART